LDSPEKVMIYFVLISEVLKYWSVWCLSWNFKRAKMSITWCWYYYWWI